MTEKFEYTHKEEIGKEERDEEESHDKSETYSVNNDNEAKDISWKVEQKEKGEDENGNGGYKKVEINSLKPSEVFYLQNEDGKWIPYTHVIKKGDGLDVTYFRKNGGEKMVAPWNMDVYIRTASPKQEKFQESTLSELKPGDEFITEDGRKGKVIMKYSPNRPEGEDISVYMEDEGQKSFLPWDTKVKTKIGESKIEEE